MNDWNRYAAEFFGTFTLVFIGSLSLLAAVSLDEPILVPVALGFGLALLAGLYAFGEISGGHFNPGGVTRNVPLCSWRDRCPRARSPCTRASSSKKSR